MKCFLEPRTRRDFLRLLREYRFATTPTSMVNRLMGLEAFTDALNFGGVAQTFAAGTTIGGSAAGTIAPVNVTASTITLTQALHAGRVVTLNRAAGIAVTPAAATGTGDTYRLFVGTTISSNTTTIDFKAGAAADVIYGWLQTNKAGTFTSYATASNSNLITLDGSTMGGVKGDWIELTDVGTNLWVIRGFLTQSGTIASPFSNH